MKILRQIKNLKGKRVLVRADLDVPLKNGKIIDDSRLKRILPTIDYLIKKHAQITLIGHAGRPNGKVVPSLSLKPIDKYFKNKNITVLENLRFFSEEGKNSKKFAKILAGGCDLYINEAFANSHRAHASMDAIQKYLPSYMGLHLERELKNLSNITKESKKPVILIIGGAKIETKLPVIKKFIPKADYILLGGVIANIFLTKSKKINPKLILPVDVRLKNKQVIPVERIKKNNIILDIGPKTIKNFINIIKTANVIIWNGPMGKFEDKGFDTGTKKIADAILKSSAKIVIGGGDTHKIFKNKKIPNNIFISSGGGAMLEFLAGKKLPGIK